MLDDYRANAHKLCRREMKFSQNLKNTKESN